MVIANWSLANENHFPNGSIAIYKFSILNAQSPSKVRFLGAAPVMLELSQIIGTCFCTATQRLSALQSFRNPQSAIRNPR
jgi:hypothetical protein